MEIPDLFLQCYSPVILLLSLVVLLLVYLILSSSFITTAEEKEPPGPIALPLLGNLLQLGLKAPHKTLLKFYRKYGPVFTIYLGPQKVVVLAGYEAVKEALVDYAEEFGDRDPPLIVHDNFQGNGIIWGNGESWKELRRFTLRKMKDFGMGKMEIEDKISAECRYLIEAFKQYKGEAFNVAQPVSNAVSNIICSMTYGSRFEYTDPEFTCLVYRTCRNNLLLSSTSVKFYNLFPWISKWFSNPREYKKSFAVNRKQHLKILNCLKETLDPQRCRGFVDSFLVQKQNLEKSGITNSHFHDENLLMTVLNLFVAGTDTTATTLKWGLMLMAKYPKIQDQVQEELGRVIGGRQVQGKDRISLPFTDAVIHETQRVVNIAPLSLPHRTTQDIIFRGHFIKKGTTVYPYLMSVLYEESEWERPRDFYPAHFLDKDGTFAKRAAFMPFSAGCRMCPGESLARTELFIFFSTLLQHFRFTPPPGVSDDEFDLTRYPTILLKPAYDKLCAIPRV